MVVRIGIVLIVLIAAVGLVVSPVSAEYSAAPDCSADVSYAGSGTESDPYEVSDVYELQCMAEDLDAHYVLVSNIDASVTSDWNSGAGFEPIGHRDGVSATPDPFTGSLDGQGYSITGLFVYEDDPVSDYGNLGLFGVLDGEARNLVLEEFDVTLDYDVNRAGTLAGRLNGLAENILVRDSEVEGYAQVGGVIGGGEGTLQQAATYDTEVYGRESHVGGIIGSAFVSAYVSDVYVIGGSVHSDTEYRTAALIGRLHSSEFAGGYSVGVDTTTVGVYSHSQSTNSVTYYNSEKTDADSGSWDEGLTTEEMTGADAEANMASLDFESVWTTVTSPDDYPRLLSIDYDSTVIFEVSDVDEGLVDGATITVFDDGTELMTVSTAADGSAYINLEDGNYDYSVEHEDFEVKTGDFTVTDDKTVEVELMPIRSVWIDAPPEAEDDADVTFTAQVENIDPDTATFTWSSDDVILEETEGQSITHNFAESGEYTVTVDVTDEYGDVFTDSHTIDITDIPSAAINYNVSDEQLKNLEIGDFVEFEAVISNVDEEDIDSIVWTVELGDLDKTTDSDVLTQEIESSGNYTVTLEVETEDAVLTDVIEFRVDHPDGGGGYISTPGGLISWIFIVVVIIVGAKFFGKGRGYRKARRKYRY